jgi:bacillithiol biosynthesis deacetylase BshB1
MEKLDFLAFAAHPDDAEISAGGTIAKMIAQGKKGGIIDLTGGELGSRGSVVLREKEAAQASAVLGLNARENLGLKDGFFERNEDALLRIITAVRKYQPDIVLCNSVRDRHPDHGRAGALVAEACFLAGLRKIRTAVGEVEQIHWRPGAIYHYIQDYHIEPDLVVDVTNFFDIKMASISAYSSQFFDPKSDEPETPISGADFFEFLKARAMNMGRPAGFKLAEGFTVNRYIGVDSLFDLK